MTADMTDAREKLDLAMKAAREVISQLEHLTATPERNVSASEARKLFTGVTEDLEEFYSEWLHAMQAVGNSEDDRGQREIGSRKDEVVKLTSQLREAWTRLEEEISIEHKNRA